MQGLTRFLAALSIIILIAGGSISAARQEEIYLICPYVWCKVAANILQLAGGAAWGFGVLFVGLFLWLAVAGLFIVFTMSVIVIFQPKSKVLLGCAGTSYFGFALMVGGALHLIYTNKDMGSLLRNASGPELSHYYMIFPILFLIIAVLFLLFSLVPLKEEQRQAP